MGTSLILNTRRLKEWDDSGGDGGSPPVRGGKDASCERNLLGDTDSMTDDILIEEVGEK